MWNRTSLVPQKPPSLRPGMAGTAFRRHPGALRGCSTGGHSLLCSLHPPSTRWTHSILSAERLQLTAPLAFLILEMGSTSSATTCYFPPDVPATTISKCPQMQSLPAGCFAQQSEEMHIKGPQPPNTPFREVPHAHFQEMISPPCGLSRYCHLIIQRESQLQAQRMIPRFFCTWPTNQENGCKSQDFSHLNAKFHEKYTHQRFFSQLSTQNHKTVSDQHLCSSEGHEQQRLVRGFMCCNFR